ncbi:MAG: hypothetical protein RL653_544, partial [Pseudomonadota bacterium]
MNTHAYQRPDIVEALGDGSSIVEAAAGTGKTWTIEQLVADQLLTHGVPFQRILVVTFTRKAAGELTERIRGQLQSLLRSPSATPTERERLLGALRHFDEAQISTIHSFCQRVLTEYSVLANQLPSALPPPDDLPRRAFRTCLRRDFLVDAGAREALAFVQSAGWTMESLEAVLVECVKSRATLVPSFSKDALRAAWKALAAVLDAHGQVLADHVLGNDSLDEATSALVPAYAAVPLDDAWAQAAFFLDWRKRLDKSPSELFKAQAGKHAPPKTVPLGDRVPALIPHFQALSAAFAALESAFPGAEAVVGSVLAPFVLEEVQRLRRESGHLDHDGVVAATREALCGPHAEALVAALRRTWSVALVDEFQDTDDIQWALLRAVFLDAHNRHRLVAVGDPKQAIYSFRGGDVLTYVNAAKDIEAVGKRQPLEGNFRSTAAYVSAVNQFFGDTSPGVSFFRNPEVQYRSVKAMDGQLALSGLENDSPRPFQLMCLPAGIGKAGKAAHTQALVKTLLGLLEAMDKGATWTRGPRGETQRLTPSDLLCLTFTNKECRQLAAHLRAAGIAVSLYREGGLLSGPEAADILDVLAALASPTDASLRRRAWLTPFFDARFESLRDADALAADHPFNALLDDWAQKASSRDWTALFASMLQRSGLNRRLLFVPGGVREYANYQSLFELLLARTRGGHDSLPDLLRALDGWKDGAGSEDGDTHPLPSDAAAVRVLTVHKAKGLQAPFVFLHGGTSPGKTTAVKLFHRDGQRFGWVGSPDKAHKVLVQQAKVEEQLRTLYVALTRARFATWIPFSGPFPGKDGLHAGLPKTGHMKLLVEALASRLGSKDFRDLCEVHVVDLPTTSRPVPPRKWNPPAKTTLPAPTPAELRELSVLREKRRGLAMRSYSSLSGKVDPGKQPAERPQLPKVDTTKVPRGKAMGTYVHALLEELPAPRWVEGETLGDWLRRDEIAAYWAKISANTSLKGAQLEDAKQLVFRAYGTPLVLPTSGHPLPGLGLLDTFQAEVEFRFPLPEGAHPRLGEGRVPPRWTVERGHLKGFMDFVFTDSKRRLYFGDWKTNTLLDYAPTTVAADVEANYREQIRIYTLALCRAAGIRDRDDYGKRFG